MSSKQRYLKRAREAAIRVNEEENKKRKLDLEESYRNFKEYYTAPIGPINNPMYSSSIKKPGYKKTKNLAKRVATLEKVGEIRYILANQVSLNSTPGVAGTPQLLNGCTRGSTIQQRTADKIVLMGGRVHGVFTCVGPNPLLRVLIYLDKDVQKTANTAATILQTATGNVTNFLDLNNKSITARFRILHDRVHQSQNTTVQNSTDSFYSNKIVVKANWGPINYEADYKGGGAGDVTDITKGAVYMLLISENTAANIVGTFKYDAIQYFKD